MRTKDQPVFDFDQFLDQAPEEIKPVAGTLHYRQIARAKILIADLAGYVVRETQGGTYFEPMSEEKAQLIFAQLDRLIQGISSYQGLGPEVSALVQAGKDFTLGQGAFLRFRKLTEAVQDLPDVRMAHLQYMARIDGKTATCFYCNEPIELGGGHSSTEAGVYWGCSWDYLTFENPDSFI